MMCSNASALSARGVQGESDMLDLLQASVTSMFDVGIGGKVDKARRMWRDAQLLLAQ